MLKQVVLAHKIGEKRAQLQALKEKREEMEKKREALSKREAELETAIGELTEDTPQEERDALDAETATWQAESDALDAEVAANDQETATLSQEIDALQTELDGVNERARQTQEQTQTRKDNTRGGRHMTRDFFGLHGETRDAIFQREDVRDFLGAVRSRDFRGLTPSKTRAVENGELLIPEVFLPILRQRIEQVSKLVGVVNHKVISGKARQNVMGAYPEGIWLDQTDALQELNLSFYTGVELDGYKVGGYIFQPTSILEDADDVDLASEILNGIAWGIGRSLDKAIVYGTDQHMPMGILTRLAQTAAPAGYSAKRLPWTDLHESHIISIPDTTKALDLFKQLVSASGVMKNRYATGERTWLMNETTHMELVVQAMSINATGAIVTGMGNQMPIIGGNIVELEWLPDDVIIGMYGQQYLLVERKGTSLMESTHARFIEDQVGFRGTARYDGEPVIGEGFVAIGLKGKTPKADDVTIAAKTDA